MYDEMTCGKWNGGFRLNSDASSYDLMAFVFAYVTKVLRSFTGLLRNPLTPFESSLYPQGHLNGKRTNLDHSQPIDT